MSLFPQDGRQLTINDSGLHKGTTFQSVSAVPGFFTLCRQMDEKLDVALVVSVGSGIFPVQDLGKTDAQQFLYFGRHWLKAGHSIKARAKSLITLLTTAVRPPGVAELYCNATT